MMLSNRITAKSREENPATQARSKIVKIINFLHPAVLSMKFSHIVEWLYGFQNEKLHR